MLGTWKNSSMNDWSLKGRKPIPYSRARRMEFYAFIVTCNFHGVIRGKGNTLKTHTNFVFRVIPAPASAGAGMTPCLCWIYGEV